MRQKRKVVLAIVPARKRDPQAPCPYVVDSCRSRRAASGLEQAFTQRSKKGGGGGEREPSEASASGAKATESGAERKDDRYVGRHLPKRWRPAEAQNGVRASFSGHSCHAERRWVVAGPGL